MKYNVAIFEDECYADLLWEGIEAPPALYALDPGCVIHIGSFSKSLAPALRLGYVISGWEIMSRLLPLKGDSGTGALDQMIVAEYFSAHFDDHLSRLNGVLHDKLNAMTEAVEKEFGSVAECWAPKGGIFLWIRLPDTIDVRKLVKPAADAGIAFNPGPEWAVSRGQLQQLSASLLRDAKQTDDTRRRRGIGTGLLRTDRNSAAQRQRRPGSGAVIQGLRDVGGQQGMGGGGGVQVVKEEIAILRRTRCV